MQFPLQGSSSPGLGVLGGTITQRKECIEMCSLVRSISMKKMPYDIPENKYHIPVKLLTTHRSTAE